MHSYHDGILFAEHDAKAWPVCVSLPDYGHLCHKRECLFYAQLVSEIYEQKKGENKQREKSEHGRFKKLRKRRLDF